MAQGRREVLEKTEGMGDERPDPCLPISRPDSASMFICGSDGGVARLEGIEPSASAFAGLRSIR